jgi:L-arabinose isomerase
VVQQTVEQNRPLLACWRFHFLALWHAQGPSSFVVLPDKHLSSYMMQCDKASVIKFVVIATDTKMLRVKVTIDNLSVC